MSTATSTSLHDLTLAEQSRQLATGQTTSVALTQHALGRIAAHAELGAFLHVDAQGALAAAAASDARRAAGQALGALDGLPIAHKDIFVTQGLPTTAASKMLKGYMSPFDATVVAQLKSAGAVAVGKLNCDEFAMGGSNENSAYGVARNPWDTSRIPGGSSGASAVAVAARLVGASTGTDTGGSIRQPAALTGITGIKPTYGRCSRYGMIAFASSLDQAGPMARTAEDCAMLLQAMSGFDVRDATSAQEPVPDYIGVINTPRADSTTAQPLLGLRVGVPIEWIARPANETTRKAQPLNPGPSEEIQQATWNAIRKLEELGATLVNISLPRTELSIPVYYIIAPAEASSNLSRFDGVKFGHRAAKYGDLNDMYRKTRAEGFGPEVKRRIMIGAYVLSHGYYDAYYLQAQKLRRMIADDFQAAFKVCDVIAGPVSPSVARPIGSQTDPVAEYLADIFTLPASLAGLPGMSIPCGFSEHNLQNPLPIGLQLIGNYWQEAGLLHTAHAFQQATDWHQHRPASLS